MTSNYIELQQNYSNVRDVPKFQTGLIRPQPPSLNNPSTRDMQFDSVFPLFVNPAGWMQDENSFVLNCMSVRLADNQDRPLARRRWTWPPSTYFLYSVYSEYMYDDAQNLYSGAWNYYPGYGLPGKNVTNWRAGDTQGQVWQGGAVAPIAGGDIADLFPGLIGAPPKTVTGRAVSTRGAAGSGEPEPPAFSGNRRTLVYLEFYMKQPNGGAFQKTQMPAVRRVVNSDGTFDPHTAYARSTMPHSWAAAISSCFKDVSIFSLARSGISYIQDNTISALQGVDPYPWDHEFQGPFFCYIFDSAEVQWTLWRFDNGNPEWPYWCVRWIGVYEDSKVKCDIYMHCTSSDGDFAKRVYWEPPMDKWGGGENPVAVRSRIQNSNGLNYDRGEVDKANDRMILRFAGNRFNYAEALGPSTAFCPTGWGRTFQEYRPARLMTITFEYDWPQNTQAGAVIAGLSVAHNHTAYRFARPMPPLPDGRQRASLTFPVPPTGGSDTWSAAAVRSNRFITTYAEKTMVLQYQIWVTRAKLFVPECGFFYELMFRPDNFPDNFILQWVTCHWTPEDVTGAWCITPMQPFGSEMAVWPTIGNVRTAFVSANCTNLSDFEPSKESEFQLWPQDPEFARSTTTTQQDFYALGWFEEYSPDFISTWKLDPEHTT